MKTQETTIQCPSCGTAIDVNDLLKHQLEDTIRKEYLQKASKETEQLTAKATALEKEKEAFEAKKKLENELFAERLEKEKKVVEKMLTEKLSRKLQEEQKDQLDLLNKELFDKTEKIKELNRSKAEIAKLQREKMELKDSIEAESQKQLNEQLANEKIKIKKQAEEENELRLATLRKQLDDQRKLTEEMKRKQEQGSMQLQGEVLELAMEEYLKKAYPIDTVNEIKKGAYGADCMQTVHNQESQNCGIIYYEGKRAKSFQLAWIEKFKNDIRDKKAAIGVLVTEVLPSDMDRMGMKDGIWICTYEEFKGLSGVLRQSLIQLNTTIASQENKGDKMAMLYDFLTSNEFRHHLESIVEGFVQMKEELTKEQNTMQRVWKQREKQIEKVTINTIQMYGSIRGIAGNAVRPVAALELENIGNDEN